MPISLITAYRLLGPRFRCSAVYLLGPCSHCGSLFWRQTRMILVQCGEQRGGYNLLSKHQTQHPEKAFPDYSCLGSFKNLTHLPLYCAGRMIDHPGFPERAGVFELDPHLLTTLSVLIPPAPYPPQPSLASGGPPCTGLCSLAPVWCGWAVSRNLSVLGVPLC